MSTPHSREPHIQRKLYVTQRQSKRMTGGNIFQGDVWSTFRYPPIKGYIIEQFDIIKVIYTGHAYQELINDTPFI